MPRPTLKNRLLLAFFGAPALVALLLALVELGFVVAGCDPRQHYFVRATDEQGGAIYVASSDTPIPNTRFRTERFPQRPPAGTKRIACIGDSTCYGLPFDPPVPFYCRLEARLKELLPQTPTEVVTLGSSGFSTEDVLDVLRDTDGAGADIVVVYAGHNVFLDGNLLPVVRPLAHAVRRVLSGWRSGAWLLARVKRALDASVVRSGDPRLVRDEPIFSKVQLERGWNRYRDELSALVALAQARGATVLLVHPIADDVDTPPQASNFAPSTSEADRERVRTNLDEVRRTRRELEAARREGRPLDRGALDAALATVSSLLVVDGSVALVHHERGRLLQLAGVNQEARREYDASLTFDADPVRATPTIHAVLDDVARRRGALVVDPRQALDAAAAPDLPGQNGWFVDYCHPDLRGHELLADVILHALAQADLLAPRAQWRFGAEPTTEEYLKRGGYSAATQADSWAKRALFKLGVSHFGGADEKAVDAAQGLFERALKLDERCVTAWIGLGIVATIRRQADPAIANFDRAAAIEAGALDQIAGPYRANPAVKALFDAAGLVFENGRVVRAR